MLIKHSARADDNSAPEAAAWQHRRQGSGIRSEILADWVRCPLTRARVSTDTSRLMQIYMYICALEVNREKDFPTLT